MSAVIKPQRFSFRKSTKQMSTILLGFSLLAGSHLAQADEVSEVSTQKEETLSTPKEEQAIVPQVQDELPKLAFELVKESSGSVARGDDYPSSYKNSIQGIDKWRLYTRQCTSFAAFRLSSVNGFEIPGAYGNANEWGHRARREGYRVDKTPTIGSIAWTTEGKYGHVAWVSNVVGDMVEIEEYNYGFRERYNRRVVKASSMTGFIHFKDLHETSNGGNAAKPSLPSSGTHYFTQKAAIRNQPSQSASVIDYYYPGESVSYDQVVEREGVQWLSYISRSGNRRYIQQGAAASKDGWIQQGGVWKYQENGTFVTGWKKVSGTWYYMQSDGVMATGWVKDKGTWYYLNSSGAMQTGWVKDKGTWYYLNSSGAMQTGWLKDKDTWYYLEDSGAMKASQWFQVSGKYYYVNSSGALAVNTFVDGYAVDANGARVTGSNT